jgi:hypothetical protein
MKLRDLVSIARNHNNKQTNLSLKKKVLKNLKITEEDLLEIEVDKFMKKRFNKKW